MRRTKAHWLALQNTCASAQCCDMALQASAVGTAGVCSRFQMIVGGHRLALHVASALCMSGGSISASGMHAGADYGQQA